MMDRELRLEVTIPYCTDNSTGNKQRVEMVKTFFKNYIDQNLDLIEGGSFSITDDELNDSPAKLICPHCKRNIFDTYFTQENER